uniref:Uncharacterized protein n=1 Tax=Timema poppense TaxID=170557 RepID=A0A7R9HI86_TIMPO|nr:unnamed protein product [Timema poppensis]
MSLQLDLSSGGLAPNLAYCGVWHNFVISGCPVGSFKRSLYNQKSDKEVFLRLDLRVSSQDRQIIPFVSKKSDRLKSFTAEKESHIHLNS